MRTNERVARQIGGALRRIRRVRRTRQKEVAERAGISKSMLCSYELGRKFPSLPNLIGVLKALGCSADEFGRHVGPWGSLD